MVRPERIARVLRPALAGPFGAVLVYCLTRTQRVNDNFALFYAQQLAAACSMPLLVVARVRNDRMFGASAGYADGVFAAHHVCSVVHAALAQLHIPMLCFEVPSDEALFEQVVLPYARDCHAHAVVGDYDPDPRVRVRGAHKLHVNSHVCVCA